MYVYRTHCVRLFEIPWTVVHQAPLFMGFPRQEYWSGLPFPPAVDLPKPGIEPESPAFSALQVASSQLSHWGSPSPMREEPLLLVPFYR